MARSGRGSADPIKASSRTPSPPRRRSTLDEENDRDAEAEAEYTNGPHDVPFVRSVPDDGFACDFVLWMLCAGSTAGADARLIQNLEVRATWWLVQATLGVVLIPTLEHGEHPGGSALLLNVPLVLPILNWDPGIDVVAYTVDPEKKLPLVTANTILSIVAAKHVDFS